MTVGFFPIFESKEKERGESTWAKKRGGFAQKGERAGNSTSDT